MTLTLSQKDKFLRNQKAIDKIVRKVVREEGGVIFGARSVNKQIKPHLRKHTEDFDVFTKKDPKKFAQKVEKRLDKKFGGNFYEVKPALHSGTSKVINRVSKRGIVDASKHPKEKIKVVIRKGVKFAHTDFQKRQIKKSLADPKSKFRHDKDRFSRLRIQLNEQAKKKQIRKPVKRRSVPQGLQFNLPQFRINPGVNF